jgi:hypothetical protein
LPTVSDLIAIKLQLDSSGLMTGGQAAVAEVSRVKQTLQQQGEQIERLTKNLGEGIATAIRSLAGLAGIVFTFDGFKNLILQATEAGTSIGRFSEAVDVSATSIGELEQAFKSAGGRSEEIRPLIAKMKSDIMAVRMGRPQAEWMTMLGLGPFGMGGLQYRSPDDILMEVSRKAQGMQATQLGQFLPGLGLSPANLAVMTRPGLLQNRLGAVGAAGTAPTPAQVGAAGRLTEKFATLEQLNTAVLRDLVTITEPLLTSVINFITGALEWLDGIERKLIGSTTTPEAAGGGMIGGRSGFGGYRPYRSGGGSGGGMGTGGGERFGIEGPDRAWAAAKRNLAEERAKLVAELNSPGMRDRMMALTNAEVGGQGPEAAQAFMETVFNRAAARGQTLNRTMQTDYYPGLGDPGRLTDAERAAMGPLIDKVTGGSNISGYATGNASGGVGFAGGPQTSYVRGGRLFSGATGGGPVGATSGGAPAAFIVHHTGGRGDVAGVQATLAQRGLGVQYVMDRNGRIYQIGGPGSSHMMTGWGAGAGLSNANTVGMEVIARDDRDVTPEQIAAAQAFIAKNYPNIPVYGHGEVNPGHKEATEGMSIVGAIRAQRSGLRSPGSLLRVPNVATGAAAAASAPQPEHKTINNENSASIQHIEVNTHATDAAGIAKDVKEEVGRQLAVPSFDERFTGASQ